MRTLLISAIAFISVLHSAGAQVYPDHFEKISALKGGLTVPLTISAQFGIESAAIGDLDDDGVIDLGIGATNQGGILVGSLIILYMNSDGTVKSSVEVTSTDSPLDQDSFGSSVCALGDLNDDGVEDIGVGAGYDSDGGFQTGAFWILFMNKNGTVKSRQKISKLAGNFTAPLQEGYVFGTGAATVGDLDGDGNIEIAVGARIPGTVYILFLNNNGTVKSYKTVSGADGLPIDPGGLVGYGLTGLGDVDGDGVPDIAIGGHRSDVNFIDSGVVFVVFLKANGTVKTFTRISSGHGNFNDTGASLFGVGVIGIGDYDGDGIRDMVVGGDDSGTNQGAIWYVMLNKNGTVKSHHKISNQTHKNELDLSDGDFFGGSFCFMGDINKDGVPDIAIGAFGDDDGGTNKGAMWIPRPACAANATAGSTQTVCTAQSVTMNANTPQGGGTGTWSIVKGSAQFSSNTDPKATVTNLGAGENIFKWSVTLPGCSSANQDVTINVREKPSAKIDMPDSTYTCLSKYEIVAATPDGTGTWQVTKGTATISNASSEKATITFSEPNKPVDVTWTVTRDGCPPAEEKITLIPIKFIASTFPNVITPDNDGKNDRWRIPNIERVENHLRLFNRWGEEVLSAPNYKNNWSGGDLTPGVYFYYLGINECNLDVKGWLTIIH
ncbi:MAG TPA: gliding motility-associated C-terminal domain-containing protein [Cyclobacteriaceae bacterium]|nr:gliding motility-associated C-terminal domain-containing protein [Cyclobacteriaceae bacterium]